MLSLTCTVIVRVHEVRLNTWSFVDRGEKHVDVYHANNIFFGGGEVHALILSAKGAT